MAALDGAFARVDRADEHLANLKERADAYLKPLEDHLVVRVAGRTIQVPQEVPQGFPGPPIILGILIGETVQNLRTALDYLIFELANWYSGPDPERRTQFPIESRPEGFKGRIATFLEGVLDEHVALVKRLQPFDRPNWLSRIRDISNTDKHEVITLIPGIIGKANVHVGPDVTAATLKGGFAKPEDPVGMYFRVSAQIALEDRTAIVPLLEQLIAQTRDLLKTFEPIFKTAPPPRVLTHRRPPSKKRRKKRRNR